MAQKWILTRGTDNIRDLLPGPILPPVIDKELLVEAEKELGLSLRSYQEAREWLQGRVLEPGPPRVRHHRRPFPRLTVLTRGGDPPEPPAALAPRGGTSPTRRLTRGDPPEPPGMRSAPGGGTSPTHRPLTGHKARLAGPVTSASP